MNIQQRVNQLQYYAHSWLQVIQNILLNILLFIIYFLGIGITKIVIVLFDKKLLKPFRVKKTQDSFWTDAKGYDYKNQSTLDKQV